MNRKSRGFFIKFKRNIFTLDLAIFFNPEKNDRKKDAVLRCFFLLRKQEPDLCFFSFLIEIRRHVMASITTSAELHKDAIC